MALTRDIVSQFAKLVTSNTSKSGEKTVYGTIVEYNGSKYVKLDGSDLLTPVSSTTNVANDERVTVMIKNHTATVTGNLSSPSVRTQDVNVVVNTVVDDAISELTKPPESITWAVLAGRTWSEARSSLWGEFCNK